MQSILIVENNAKTSSEVKTILNSVGFYVTTASTGSEALAIMDHQHFDLMISDVYLPDMRGYALVKAAQGADIHMSCILMSEYGLTRDHKPMFSEDYFLTSPFDVEELTEAVMTCLMPESTRYPS